MGKPMERPTIFCARVKPLWVSTGLVGRRNSVDTGNLSARFVVALKTVSEKGKTTVDLLQLDRREAVSGGYLKSWARMKGAAERFLHGQLPESKLAHELIQTDDHGLLGWCTRGAGSNEWPFDQVWAKAPEVLKLLEKSS